MEATYPRLTQADVREFIETVVRSDPSDMAVLGFLNRRGLDDPKFANARLTEVVTSLLADCGQERNKALEPVEAKHCGPVHRALSLFPDEALGDEQFWSWLAVRHFWRFISYRQENAWRKARGEPADPNAPHSEAAKLERYIRGADHYQIPLRLYLRAEAVRNGDDYALTSIDGGGTDFWRSQILGVRTSAYPPLARAVARAQSIAKLNVDDQRPPGRRVNRLRVNIDFILHDDDESDDAIEPLWLVTETDFEKKSAKRAAKAATANAAKVEPSKRAAKKRAPAGRKTAPDKKPAAKKPAARKPAASQVVSD
jgi:hypothetical protein